MPADLARCGVRRINVSLDSLDPETYARITRGGRLDQVIDGIDAALAAGLEVKINAVALRDDNLHDLVGLAEWAHARGAALTVIEVMPMGSVEAERVDQHVPMTEVRRRFEQRWTLTDLARRTGGPARYVRTDEGGTIGFITPAEPQFLRRLQPGAGDLHRRNVHVPRPGRAGRPARPAPRLGGRHAARCGDRRGDRAQAQGPRLRHPRRRRARRCAAHVGDGGMKILFFGRLRDGAPAGPVPPGIRDTDALQGMARPRTAPSCSTHRSASPSTTR